ncbi:MAG: M13 family metallopeptidase [Gammaproteobacteria bacterium]
MKHTNKPSRTRRRIALTILATAFLAGSCTTAHSPLQAVFDPAGLDPAVRPQDDFWNYVNGTWLASTRIPPDQSSYGSFQIVAERTEGQLRAIVEEAAAKTSGNGASASSDEQKIGALYASFMDEARVEALGIEPLAPDLAAIDALRTHDDVIGYFGKAMAEGVQAPVQWFVDADATDPSRNLAYFWQDGLGLPNRDYYLDNRPELQAALAAYQAHIEKLCGLAGWADGAAAARTILVLEKRIAERHWSSVQNRDDEKIYRNQVSLPDAVGRFPGFNWPRFLAAAGIDPPGRFVVAQTDYFEALGPLVRSVPVADWQTWLRFKTLKHYAPFLASAIAGEDFAFEGGTLKGIRENKARWKRGVQLASSELGDLAGKAYVARHFPPSSKARMDRMIAELTEAFRQSIDNLDWMTPATRRAAQEKLGKFRSKIGYPDRWKDYSAVTVRTDDLVGNVRHTQAFAHAYAAARIRKPVDPDEWLMTPQTVNAYYQQTANEIAFPAAILQPPFFDPAADDAQNYGAIGAIIGHEISHGFDDQGRKYDGDGRLRDWWTPTDADQYTARAQKLVTRYDGFRPLPNFHVNGQLTLGENIADLAGLTMAYRAWRLSLKGQEAPVIGGYTGEQRLFIGFALAFRGMDRPERLQSLLLSDPHSPDEYRVRGVLPNVAAFYSAFGVAPGDKMYLPPADRVAIW